MHCLAEAIIIKYENILNFEIKNLVFIFNKNPNNPNMKKIKLLSITILLFSLTISKSVANLNDFDLDETKIENAFQSVAALEEVLLDNSLLDYSSVQLNFPTILASANQSNQLAGALSLASGMEDSPALGITGYIWGGCLGLIGILAVYLILDDSSKDFRQGEVKKAAIGCAASAVLYTGYIFLVARRNVI
jgi:hypothetical protein